MASTTLNIKNGEGITKYLAVEDNGAAGLSPYHLEDATQRAALITALGKLSSETKLEAVRALLAGTLAVSVNSLPLPAGAATLANQTTANTSLATIASQTANLSTAAGQTAANSSLSTIASQTAGLATSAKQDSAQTSLSAIATSVAAHATSAKQDSAQTSLTAIANQTTGLATAAAQTTANTALSTIATQTTGLATSAKQDSANTSLSAIASQTSGLATATGQTTANTSLASIATQTAGLATAVGQTSANTTLNAINTKLGTTLVVNNVDGAGVALRATAGNVSGSFSATGASAALVVRGDFNVSFWGTFNGTLVIERSFDTGTTWLPLTALGNAIAFTSPSTEIFSEPEAAVRYRVRCTNFTSGTINYRLSL